MKIGILGGTFNPPHNGHLFLAKQLFGEFSLDKVLLIPTGTPPHKRDISVAEDKHRLNMLRCMVGEFPYMEVSDIEMKRPGYTYTVDTLTELEKLYLYSEFKYIIGTDTLFELTTWKEFETVFTMTDFICVMRPGDDTEKVNERIAYMKEKYGKVVLMSGKEGPDISSTDIRNRLKLGKSIEELVPACVREYIEEHHVY